MVKKSTELYINNNITIFYNCKVNFLMLAVIYIINLLFLYNYNNKKKIIAAA